MKIFFIICLIFPFSLRAEYRKIPTSCEGTQCVNEPYYIDITSIENGKNIYFSIKSPQSEFECKTISIIYANEIPPSTYQSFSHSSYSNEIDGEGYKSYKFKIKSNSDYYHYIYFTLNANIRSDIVISIDQLGNEMNSIVKYILIALGCAALFCCLICCCYYCKRCQSRGSGSGSSSGSGRLVDVYGYIGTIRI